MTALSADPRLNELAGQIAWAAEAHKGFDLFFVVANTHAAAEGFSDALRRALPEVVNIDLREEPRRLLSILRDDLPAAINVQVTGLDAHARAPEASGGLFGSLNIDRDAIRALGKNLIFVLPSFALTALAQSAPDFYDFRTVTLNVAEQPDDPDLSPLRFGTPVLATTPQDRDRWIEVIRAQPLSSTSDDAIRTLTLARLLEERGSYVEAESRLRSVIAMDLGREAPSKLLRSVYNTLGNVLLRSGRILEAKEAYVTAERMTRDALGEEHADLGTILSNLGNVLHSQGDFTGALAYFQQAERIIRASSGRDDPKLGTALSNLGNVYQNSGDLKSAIPAYMEAASIFRSAYGADHPSVGVTLNNIGSALRHLGNPTSALTALRDAERIFRSAYGDGHPDVARCLDNIGHAHHIEGDLDRALSAHREAERIGRKALGKDHPSLAVWAYNIGAVLWDQGDRKGALDACKRALIILLKTEGSSVRDLAQVAQGIRSIGEDPVSIARKQIGEKAARKVKKALKRS